MLIKLINFLTNTITTNMAVIIPIAAAAAGFILKALYKMGGIISMLRKFMHNRKRTMMEIEEERNALVLKQVTQIEQIINRIKEEMKNESDEEMKKRFENKIKELSEKKKELLLKL